MPAPLTRPHRAVLAVKPSFSRQTQSFSPSTMRTGCFSLMARVMAGKLYKTGVMPLKTSFHMKRPGLLGSGPALLENFVFVANCAVCNVAVKVLIIVNFGDIALTVCMGRLGCSFNNKVAHFKPQRREDFLRHTVRVAMQCNAIDKNDKCRLMDISARASNRGGAALRFVAERLLKCPESLKLLILISDGQPASASKRNTRAKALNSLRQPSMTIKKTSNASTAMDSLILPT